MLYLIETHGPITTNTYLYGDDATQHAFLIDPGFEPERILAAIREKGITVERILLTHGHFDHIGAALAVSDALGALPICMWEKGRKYAESPNWNLSANFFPPAGFTLPAARMTYLPDGACLALAAAARTATASPSSATPSSGEATARPTSPAATSPRSCRASRRASSPSPKTPCSSPATASRPPSARNGRERGTGDNKNAAQTDKSKAAHDNY